MEVLRQAGSIQYTQKKIIARRQKIRRHRYIFSHLDQCNYVIFDLISLLIFNNYYHFR